MWGNSRETEQDFWGPVKSGLNVRINGLPLVTCRTEVDNFDDGALQAEPGVSAHELAATGMD